MFIIYKSQMLPLSLLDDTHYLSFPFFYAEVSIMAVPPVTLGSCQSNSKRSPKLDIFNDANA